MSRTSSRRTTPQPPATNQQSSSAPMARVTRSASREVADVPATQPTRSTRGGSRQASVESTGSAKGRRGRPKRGQKNDAEQDLGTVEEGGDEEVPQPSPEKESRKGIPKRSSGNPALNSSPRRVSNLSGSITIVEDLNPREIVESLPVLHYASEAILEVHRGSLDGNFLAELQDPESAGSKRLARKEPMFDAAVAPFGGGGDHFIRPDQINQALYGPEIATQQMSHPLPDDVVYKANLCILLKRMTRLGTESAERLDLLRELDATFPLQFLSSVYRDPSPQGTTSAQETLTIALAIRTQLAIMLLAQSGSFEPIIESIFLNQTEGRVRGWKAEGLFKEEGLFIHEATETVVQLRSDLMAFTKARESGRKIRVGSVSYDNLSEYFTALNPWNQFVVDVLTWITHRNEEINDWVQDEGGVELIKKNIQIVLQEDPETNQALAIRSAKRGPEPQRKDYHKPQNIAFAKAFRKSTLSGPVGQPAADDGRDRSTEQEPFQPTALEMSKEYEKRNKENVGSESAAGIGVQRSIFDRQPNAQRVEWGESSQPSQLTSVNTSNRSPGKRARVEDEEDPTQDEGFQTQHTRAADVAAKRAQAPTAGPGRRVQTSASPNKRARTSQTAELHDRSSASYAPSDGRATGPTARFTQDNPPPSTYQLIKDEATQVRSKRERKQKTSWTPEQEDYLVQAIADHGCAWARIKKTDDPSGKDEGVLAGRDQVALKDKARNMKFNWIKAEAELPRGFEGVTLGKNYVERLDGFVQDWRLRYT